MVLGSKTQEIKYKYKNKYNYDSHSEYGHMYLFTMSLLLLLPCRITCLMCAVAMNMLTTFQLEIFKNQILHSRFCHFGTNL